MSVALFGFASVLMLALVGIPLGFGMILLGAGFFASIRGFEPALTMVGQTIADLAANDALAVVPMFILMGTFVHKADLAEELYDTAYAWFGHKKGGLAHATVLACAGFAAISGSSLATTATMTKVAMPSMRRLGYADSLAAGSVSCAGTLGVLIPPSVPLLIYAMLTEQDVGKLFIAGIVPGLLLAFLFFLSVGWTVHRDPTRGPPGDRSSWATRRAGLARIWPVGALFIMVIGGLYAGIFTSTEAAGIGAMGGLLILALRRKLSPKVFFDAMIETGGTTATVFTIAFGGLIFANFITLSGLTAAIVALIQSLDLPVVGVILAITLVYIVLGSLMESFAMMMITVPVFAAILQPLGVDLIWFGIFVTVMIELGMIHPPLGMNIFMVKTLMPDISIRTIFSGSIPFLVANVVLLIILIAVPDLALWLVKLMRT